VLGPTLGRAKQERDVPRTSNPPDRAGGGRGTTSSPKYELRIHGHLGETILGAFEGLTAETRGGDTVLTGVVRDQAALHGLLAQVAALGLELLELRRLPPS
jgi:hypothetical protein